MEKVDIGKKILNANETYALKNSQLLARHGMPMLQHHLVARLGQDDSAGADDHRLGRHRFASA